MAPDGDRGRTVTFVTHSGITASSTEGAAIEHVFSKPIGQGSNTVRLSYGGRLSNPGKPEAFGWLNYWSRATCDYLGFPDPNRDADLLALSRRTAAGAWLVKITAEPFDVLNTEHLKTLLNLYECFPGVGIRTLPEY